MKWFLLPFYFFFVFIHAFAQQNFTQGYIVKYPSDTIQGFINDRNWTLNPRKIEFKTTRESEATTTFTADQIRSFYTSYSDEFYYGAIVYVDRTPFELGAILTPKEIGRRSSEFIRKDTVFLRVLVKGKATLLGLEDGRSQTHFYINKTDPDTTLELQYKRFRVDNAVGSDQIGTTKEYQIQLENYLSDYQAIMNKIKTTNYNEQALKKLFFSYNEHFTPKITPYKKPEDRFSFHVYTLIGISVSQVRFTSQATGTISDYYSQAKFANSVDPTINLGLDWVMPRLRSRWSWYNEAGYRQYSYSDERNYEGSAVTTLPTAMTNEKIGIKAQTIRCLSAIRFTYPKGKARIYLQGGVTVNYSLHQSNVYTRTTTVRFLSDNPYEVYSLSIAPSNTIIIGGAGGIGMNYQRFVLECRYESRQGLTDPMLSSSLKTIHLMVGFRLL